MRWLNNAMSCEVVVFCPLEPPTDNMTIVLSPLGKSIGGRVLCFLHTTKCMELYVAESVFFQSSNLQCSFAGDLKCMLKTSIYYWSPILFMPTAFPSSMGILLLGPERRWGVKRAILIVVSLTHSFD